MRVIYETQQGTETIELYDDAMFNMNEPHGFMRVVEIRPEGRRSWYFNMQHLIAVGPSEGSK